MSEENVTAMPLDVYEEWLIPSHTLTRKAIINGVLCIAGLTTNVLMLYGTVRINRPRWKPDGILITNHWVSNILVCYIIADKMVRYMTKPFFHIAYCKLRAYLLYVSVGSSVLSLTLITLHRFFKVIFPHKSNLGFITVRRTLFIVGAQWMMNLGIVLFPLTGAMGNLGFEQRNQNCRSIVGSKRSMHSTFVFVYTFLPVTIHAVCYMKIWIRIRMQNRIFTENIANAARSHTVISVAPPPADSVPVRGAGTEQKHNKAAGNTQETKGDEATRNPAEIHQQGNKHTMLTRHGQSSSENGMVTLSVPKAAVPQIPVSSSTSSTSSTASTSSSSSTPHDRSAATGALTGADKRRKREIRLALMSFGFVLAYILCFLPFLVTSTLKILNHPVHQLAADLVWTFVAINPVIYVCGDKRIRDTLREKLRCL